MKDIEHLLRVVAVFAVVIAVFLVARAYLTPKSYGKLGRYRAASVDEEKARPIRYAGQKECASCHRGQVREKAGSSHRTVSCESCHGAAYAHAQVPSGEKPKRPAEKEMRAFCAVCHAQDISKPRGFKQVSIYEHNPGVACTQCHPPHKPKL